MELAADADAVLVDVLVLVLVVVDELDEEHAARATAQIASPAVSPAVYVEGAYRVLLTGIIGFWATASSPVVLRTVVCQYSLPASQVPVGK